MTKSCTKCGGVYLVKTGFFRDKRAKDERKSACKQCDMSIKRSVDAIIRGRKVRRARSIMTLDEIAKIRKRDADYKKQYLAHKRKHDPAYVEWKSQRDKSYRKTPNGKAAMARSKAKRKAMEAESSLTGSQWVAILEMFDRACAYCGATKNITMDHFIPLRLGGKTQSGNIVPACLRCNSSKQDKLPEVWCGDHKYNWIKSKMCV
jgi:5-methylcytosine-specific restriction endonuclease McrA